MLIILCYVITLKQNCIVSGCKRTSAELLFDSITAQRQTAIQILQQIKTESMKVSLQLGRCV